MFAESAVLQNVPVVYRLQDDRMANPDRLSLENRNLHVVPVIEGEPQLRLLNFQHNAIPRIEVWAGGSS